MKLTPISTFLSLLIGLTPLQGQQSTSVSGVVGASTITIYRVVDYTAGASTLIPHVGTGGIIGISAIGGTTGQTIQFIPNGQAVCDFSAIPTVGNLVTVSGDRCTDAGTTNIATLAGTVGVIGLTLSLQGSLCTNCALVSLYGPVRFGTLPPSSAPSDVVLAPVAFASIPSAGTAGRLQYFTDAPFVARDTGASWLYWCGSTPCQPATLTSFSTAVNSGSTTKTDAGGVSAINGAASASSTLAVWVKSTPTPPYTAVFKMRVLLPKVSFATCAIALRESGSGKLVAINFQADSTSSYLMAVGKLNSPTSFSANYTLEINPGIGWEDIWVRIVDDNTNRVISLSMNGLNWIQALSVARTDWITPDQLGFGYDPGASNQKGFCLIESYKES